jgi:Concanavalin A-like lectin/glucanases superfamily
MPKFTIPEATLLAAILSSLATAQTPPTIVRQPSSRTLLAGGSPTLVVEATGTSPLNYSWTFKGTALPGATTAALKLTTTTTASSGDYVLTISNSYGSTNTGPITLTIVEPPSKYAAAVLSDHPVSYWRMGEGSGTTLVDSVGFCDGSYSGAVALGQPGGPWNESDTAASFTGGKAEVPYTALLNGATPFSVDLWVKANNESSYHTMFSSQNRDAGRSGFALYHHVNGTGFEAHLGDLTNVTMFIYDGNPVVAGNWYHVALVYDGTNASLYVNGVLGPTSTAAGDYNPNDSKPFTLGQRTDGDWIANDVLDEAAFYDYALTQAQIQKHVAAGFGVSIARANSVVLDTKPAGTLHHGLNNGATWAASNNDGSRTQTGVMQFAGAIGNQITLVPDPDFNSSTGTISFWMRSAATLTGTGHTGSVGDGAMLFDRRGASGLVIVQAETGTIFVQPSGTNNQVLGTTPISDNKWHLITVTYDNTQSGLLKLYVDGTSDLSNTNATEWPWLTAEQIEIGLSHDTYWQKYDGYLDDIRIYNRVLSDAEVTDLLTDALVDNNALKLRFNFDAAPAPGLSINLIPSFGVLQSSGSVESGYVDLPGMLPHITVPSGSGQFFRGHY